MKIRSPRGTGVVGAATLAMVLANSACERGRSSVEPDAGDGVGSTPASSCATPDLDRVWTARRQALDHELAELPGEWPRQLVATLEARVPEQLRRWDSAYTRACAAPPGPSRGCLEAQLWALDAVLGVVVDEPDRAGELWFALERSALDPGRCEAASVDAPTLEPELGITLARAELWATLGDQAQLAAQIERLEGDARITEVPVFAGRLASVRADAAWLTKDLTAAGLAVAELRAQAAAEPEAFARPAMAGTRSRLASLEAQLAAAQGDQEGAELAQRRAVEAGREAADPWVLVDALAGGAQAGTDPRVAVTALVEAIALAGRIGGPEDPQTAALQARLATAQLALGQIEAAYDSLTQARDTFVIALGPDHPRTLATVAAMAELLFAAGRPGDAQFALLDLLEIHTELYGGKDWRTAEVKLGLADSLMALDQHASARTLYTEALVPLTQEFGAVDPRVIRVAVHLGLADLALGDLDAAALHCGRGRDLANALEPGHPLISEATQCLAALTPGPKKRTPGKRGR